MEESLEVLFVESGYYKIGYQINNQQFYRCYFGMFTTIGGFQMCYNRRFNFFYKTATELKGLAIRKNHFLQLLDKN